jgi:16S rRNA (guanine966-N2)-methyltransferase
VSGRARAGAPGQIRIVGGTWRSRRIPVPHAPGLRPTPDRVRETLFNWLQGIIVGARCLDLFAGSGALGFEAASRGAAAVTLVERDPRVAAHLRDVVRTLDAAQVAVVNRDAFSFLEQASETYDLVFLDPPFGQDLLPRACRELEARGLLAAGARIYLEAEIALGTPPLPENWEIVRGGSAGEVGYHLAIRH